VCKPSPDQMNGSDYDLTSSDIYSLGIILFELYYPMSTVRAWKESKSSKVSNGYP
jgi:serine/threonine protein kinase